MFSIVSELSEKSLLSGGASAEDPPVPIPNTEVKLSNADGTARETVWESRKPPDQFLRGCEKTVLIKEVIWIIQVTPFCVRNNLK